MILIASEAVARSVGRKAAAALRSPSTRRMLINTTVATCACWHLNIAIALWCHPRAAKASLRLVPVTTVGAWPAHRRLMAGRIWRHRICGIRRMGSALWGHGSRPTTILGKAIPRRCLRKAWSLWLRRISLELACWGTILAPLWFHQQCFFKFAKILTLHFNGRPCTLQPLNWQIAIAAFSWVSILTNAKPRSDWNLVSTTYPKFENRGTRSF